MRTTRNGCFPCGRDYAGILLLFRRLRGLRGTRLHNVMRKTSYETYKLRRLCAQDYLRVTTRDYALQARGYASTLAASRSS